MSGEGGISAALGAGAGLPVVEILEGHLARRARREGTREDTRELSRETAEDLRASLDTWLEGHRRRLQELLAQGHEGPLLDTLDHHVTTQLDEHKHQVDATLSPGGAGLPWRALTQLFGDLHALRDGLSEVHRAGDHLREMARLLEEIPQRELPQDAIDELTRLEAVVAGASEPAAWREGARELEERLTQLIDPTGPAPPAPDRPAAGSQRPNTQGEPDPEPAPAEPEPGPAEKAPEPGAKPAAKDPGPARSPSQASVQVQRPTAPDPEPPRRTWQAPAGTSAPEEGPPAGPERLSTWQEQAERMDGFRHGPFWAPIAAGELTSDEAEIDHLLAFAHEHEIDLVDIELPRILALPTGAPPEATGQAIAERAEAITRRDPTQPARTTLREHLEGKLPLAYRGSEEGQALLASLCHALARPEPWQAPTTDLATLVPRMLAAELARTPAIDLSALTESLLGPVDAHHALVQEAASQLCQADDGLLLTEDGLLVRPLTDAEDPDLLYSLRGRLTQELGEQRARAMLEALITGQEDPP